MSEENGQEVLNKLKSLNDKREQLNQRLARLQVIKEQSEQERDNLLKEMTELGTSPETINQDLKREMEAFTLKFKQSEEETKEYEILILEAEKLLEKKVADANT